MRKKIALLFLGLIFFLGPLFGQLYGQKAQALNLKNDVPTLAPLLKRVTPGVVNISVRGSRTTEQESPLLADPFYQNFFDLPDAPRQREFQSVGSGVIVDAAKGYVLTNHHVIEGAHHVTVTLKGGRQLSAKFIGSDPATDIALLSIPSDNLTAVKLGQSSSLEVGDFVVAIGNPFGLGQTVTSGIVSALGRGGLSPEGYEDFIQTDASINPGNSGGALINLNGELIGINTSIIAPNGGNVGIGFAVPSDMVKAVMRQLIEFGKVSHGKLSIAVTDLTPDIAQVLGVTETSGAIVTQVRKNSQAAKAGLRAGDVIIHVDGNAIKSAADLRNKIGLLKPNSVIAADILRDGKDIELAVRVEGEFDSARAPKNSVKLLGGAIFGSIPNEHPLHGKITGIFVAQVPPASAAWLIGLRPHDIVTTVNQRKVEKLSQLHSAVNRFKNVLTLKVLRGPDEIFLIAQ